MAMTCSVPARPTAVSLEADFLRIGPRKVDRVVGDSVLHGRQGRLQHRSPLNAGLREGLSQTVLARNAIKPPRQQEPDWGGPVPTYRVRS